MLQTTYLGCPSLYIKEEVPFQLSGRRKRASGDLRLKSQNHPLFAMEPFSLTVGVIGILTALKSCLKLVKKHVGPSTLSSGEADEQLPGKPRAI